jgi:hypothetical protein
MKSIHVKQYFLDWLDQILSAEQRAQIENHLGECQECRQYYNRMKDFLENPDLSVLPVLEADPFLPTRIKTGEKVKTPGPGIPWWKWSFATLIVLISLSLGALLGYSVSQPAVSAEQELVSEYYQIFSQNDSAYQLESVFNLQEENNQ